MSDKKKPDGLHVKNNQLSYRLDVGLRKLYKGIENLDDAIIAATSNSEGCGCSRDNLIESLEGLSNPLETILDDLMRIYEINPLDTNSQEWWLSLRLATVQIPFVVQSISTAATIDQAPLAIIATVMQQCHRILKSVHAVRQAI